MRILWVNCRLLHPVNGGDRIRTFNMLKELKKGHQISYLAPRTPDDTEDAVSSALDYCHEVIPIEHPSKTPRSLKFYAEVLANSLFGKYPYIGIKYLSPAITKKIEELDRDGGFDVIVCDYLASMVNFLEIPGGLKTPLVIFQHNVESLIWERHFRTARDPFRRGIYRRQWRMTSDFEDRCARIVDGQITVSEQELDYFKDKRGMPNILGDVPTGVDFEFFTPRPADREPSTLAFLGSMDWHANLDAVEYFVGKVYPEIKKRVPDVRFIIIGRNPPEHIRQMGREDPSITVTGTVDDVRPHMAKASAMVLPLRVGGGTRIKIFEAMAMGIPVVSTDVGAEGLGTSHGEHLLMANAPEDFAAEVEKICRQPALAEEISANALRYVRENFGWDAATRKFIQCCRKVIP